VLLNWILIKKMNLHGTSLLANQRLFIRDKL
jgi:hypothetical protein